MKVAMINITRKSMPIFKIMNGSLWDLPSPAGMTYFWNFGSMLGICLMVQLITGILLSFHYTPLPSHSFSSVVEIMQNVHSGWMIRFIHMNGASVFFLFIYLHLFRGMFYFSAIHKKVWTSGVILLIVLMAISFFGYVLPWGQMSYWGVAVITNLFSVIPGVGEKLVYWIWGGFSVDKPTLSRFYSFHFMTPFILTFLVIIHLALLHENGSSNSMGINSNMDKLPFHPYFSVKDYFFIAVAMFLSLLISFYSPYILGDTLNSVPANPLKTPIHIQPEWYFLSSYAILRCLPSKTMGVLALAASVSIFFILPMFKLKFAVKFNPFRTLIFWIMVFSFIFLLKMGAMPASEPYITMSQVASTMYFSSILLLNL